jgi:hypothetical protein
MPAKNTRRVPDMHSALGAHVEASKQAHAWVSAAIEFRKAGKAKAADAAESKAKRYLRTMMALEAAVREGQPEGGRTAKD